jgi:phytanoyl-CoA hydroxylase
MIGKQELSDYKRDGFLILKSFFKKQTIEEILRDSKRIFLAQFRDRKMTSAKSPDDLLEEEFNAFLYRLFEEDLLVLTNCGKQAQHLMPLHRLALDKEIENLLTGIGLSFPNISTRPVLFFNHPKLALKKVYHKMDAHQDWRSMQGSLNSVVIWVPLVDVNKDLGALQVVPGSHRAGLQTDHMDAGFGMVNVETSKFTSVELEQGDILLFSSFLIHQSGENITNRPRWSCHFRYNDLAERTFIERKYAHPYIYKPQEELITPDFPTEAQLNEIFD